MPSAPAAKAPIVALAVANSVSSRRFLSGARGWYSSSRYAITKSCPEVARAPFALLCTAVIAAGTAIRRASKLTALRHNRSSLPCPKEPPPCRREHDETDNYHRRSGDRRAAAAGVPCLFSTD